MPDHPGSAPPLSRVPALIPTLWALATLATFAAAFWFLVAPSPAWVRALALAYLPLALYTRRRANTPPASPAAARAAWLGALTAAPAVALALFPFALVGVFLDDTSTARAAAWIGRGAPLDPDSADAPRSTAGRALTTFTWARAGRGADRSYIYELRAGETVMATLRCSGAPWGSATATGAGIAGTWVFRPWNGVTVRREGIDAPAADLATFTYDGRWRRRQGGTLALAAGRRFRWESTDTSHAEWEWAWTEDAAAGGAGTTLLYLTVPALSADRSFVALQPQAAALPELALLETLGWYLLTLDADTERNAARE